MPTYWDKYNIFHFAAFKNHIGIYPVRGYWTLLRLVEYKTSKGAIQLPYTKPLPLDLIAEIAKWCYLTWNHHWSVWVLRIEDAYDKRKKSYDYSTKAKIINYRVAIYCRGAAEAKNNWLVWLLVYLTRLVAAKPEWKLSDIYLDIKSGSEQTDRTEFQRLLSDCRAGEGRHNTNKKA